MCVAIVFNTTASVTIAIAAIIIIAVSGGICTQGQSSTGRFPSTVLRVLLAAGQ
jgi:hypothetical protein